MWTDQINTTECILGKRILCVCLSCVCSLNDILQSWYDEEEKTLTQWFSRNSFYVRETNLKVRQALEVTADLANDHSQMAAFDGDYINSSSLTFCLSVFVVWFSLFFSLSPSYNCPSRLGVKNQVIYLICVCQSVSVCLSVFEFCLCVHQFVCLPPSVSLTLSSMCYFVNLLWSAKFRYGNTNWVVHVCNGFSCAFQKMALAVLLPVFPG